MPPPTATTTPPTAATTTTTVTGLPAPATPEATSPAPTVVPNPDVIKVLAIGDSVMLGAAEELVAAGVTVDAAESRHGLSIIEPLGMISAAGRLGSAVVIHLGTNGPTSQETLDAIMGSLVNVPAVIVLTGHFDRGWMAGNNERVRALPALYPNVTVLDWDVLAGHRTCHRIVIDDPPVGVRGVPVLAHFVEQSSELGRA